MDQVKSRRFLLLFITGLVIAVILMAPLWFGAGCKKRIVSKLSIAQTMIALIETSLQEFHMENGRYPTQEEGLLALLVGPNDLKETWDGPYIEEKKLMDPWGRYFIYRIPAEWSDEDYDVISYGLDGKLGGEGIDMDIFNGDWNPMDDKRK